MTELDGELVFVNNIITDNGLTSVGKHFQKKEKKFFRKFRTLIFFYFGFFSMDNGSHLEILVPIDSQDSVEYI